MRAMPIGVGRPAPDFALGGAGTVLCGRPVVLAFVDAWHDGPKVDRVRAELRGLGAILVVLAKNGVWSFGPDDAAERHDDAAEGVAQLYGVDEIPALFVIDGDGVVRFDYRPRKGARAV